MFSKFRTGAVFRCQCPWFQQKREPCAWFILPSSAQLVPHFFESTYEQREPCCSFANVARVPIYPPKRMKHFHLVLLSVLTSGTDPKGEGTKMDPCIICPNGATL